MGIGLYGNEGEQAASFADYALPEFKNLRRLMFIHGRSIALKLSNFLCWFVFKTCQLSVVNIYFNTLNGFSGMTIASDLFFSLNNVILNTGSMAGYMLCDQDILFRQPKIPMKKTLP